MEIDIYRKHSDIYVLSTCIKIDVTATMGIMSKTHTCIRTKHPFPKTGKDQSSLAKEE